ncbi:DNA/RNA non-specific endonuclease [Kitasatospora sp. NPDC088779]|uniref:DNA/RNA non-specific endonuclease n=1 Tax=unclassified Kitasatospora TaxID=2633591 RepID=UPI00342F91F0
MGLLLGAAAVPAASAAPAALRDCPVKYLPANAYSVHNGYQFQADGAGRPLTALAPFGTLVEEAAGRDSACTARVGHYADPLPNYDGGHLIADSLNGPSIRENLVPMQGPKVNRNAYRYFEIAVTRCLAQYHADGLQYSITVSYPAGTDPVPHTITPLLTVRSQGVDHPVRLDIPNTDLTSAQVADLKHSVDTQTAAAGCPHK